jgi:twitching motility protein PilT
MTMQVPQELERAMREAADRHASDLFMLPGEPLSFRVRGSIVRGTGEILSAGAIRAVAEAMVGADRLHRIFSDRGSIRIACDCGDVRGRMGISMARGQYTIAVAMLPRRICDVSELAIPQAVLRAAMADSGLIVFAGPVGSGKTTSAFAVLDYINGNKDVHICTVEDPINYIINPKRAIVQQREVGVDVPDTAGGMIAALGQDLDVLFVAELRTPQEVLAVVTAADMGHLVITQIHAATPDEALSRLTNSQPPDRQAAFRRDLARVLRCVVAQLLLQRVDAPGKLAAYGVLVPDLHLRRKIAEGASLSADPLPEGCRDIQAHVGKLLADKLVDPVAAKAALATLSESAALGAGKTGRN